MSDTRRTFFSRALAGASALTLAGCDKIGDAPGLVSVLEKAETLTKGAQRLLLGNALAPEFAENDISKEFRANGSTSVDDATYKALAKKEFAGWKMKVDGLVEKPLALTLHELRNMPSRTQITRHDCVEGWSCIGKWTGVPLQAVLDTARLMPDVRYIVFHCADAMEDGLSGPVRYYESIDLTDAAHPQTTLAYEMNGQTLPVAHGAPLRLRVERQLGYKMAKYIMRIEAVADFSSIGEGKGRYWEDRGYDWYAGI